MAKSFLDRIQPSRQRWKLVEWPFPVEGEKPKLKVRVLGENELEAAHFAAVDHFKARKPPVKPDDPVFKVREYVEIVWRAYSDEGEPIAGDADELAEQPQSIVEELYLTYVQLANDVASAPYKAEDMEALVELLKKNIQPGRLAVLSSTWLIGLITTLVSQLPPSTSANKPD